MQKKHVTHPKAKNDNKNKTTDCFVKEIHEQTLGTLHVGQQSKDVVEIYLFLTASVSATVHVPQPEHIN